MLSQHEPTLVLKLILELEEQEKLLLFIKELEFELLLLQTVATLKLETFLTS